MAQAPTLDVPGWSGWATALSSGAVLAWLLLVHLPNKDKQLKEMVEGRDALARNLAIEHKTALETTAIKHDGIVRDLVNTFAEQQRETRHEFRDALNSLLMGFEKRNVEMLTVIKAEFDRIRERP